MARKKKSSYNDAMLAAAVKKHLSAVHADGLKQGVFAVCKVVHDMASSPEGTDAEKLAKIDQFVSQFASLNNAEQSKSAEESKDEV